MLVETPIGETAKIGENPLRVGMENMWAVSMNQHSMFVVLVIGIAPDMRALVYHQHPLAQARSQSLRQDAPRKAGADDKMVKHALVPH